MADDRRDPRKDRDDLAEVAAAAMDVMRALTGAMSTAARGVIQDVSAELMARAMTREPRAHEPVVRVVPTPPPPPQEAAAAEPPPSAPKQRKPRAVSKKKTAKKAPGRARPASR
jgi:hypothetical protein